MPIYEYRCKSCDHEFEKFLRAGQDEPDSCPECADEAVTRLISNTNFKLKGSGWYETDYARADESSGTTGEGEGASADEDGGSASEKAAE